MVSHTKKNISMLTTSEKLIDLLGQKRNCSDLNDFINAADQVPKSTDENIDDTTLEHIEFFSKGVCVHIENNLINTVFLYSKDNDEGYEGFQDKLPFNINFELSVKEVISLLGESHEMGGNNHGPLGYTPTWLKYRMDKCYLHLGFNILNTEIKMATLIL